jgi:transcriptional regulator with XRE-family HTH domain
VTIVTPGEPQIGRAVRGERERLGWSVAALAARAGVSRAMVTRVERGEANATTAFLGKLSAAFGLQLSQLIARGETHAPRGLATEDEQGLWVDPETGHLRRQLSPPAGLAIELLEITLPARARVSYPPSAYAFVEQQIWMLEGTLQLREGGETISLGTRDCYALGTPVARTFTNPGPGSCRYLVATGPAGGTRAAARLKDR